MPSSSASAARSASRSARHLTALTCVGVLVASLATGLGVGAASGAGGGSAGGTNTPAGPADGAARDEGRSVTLVTGDVVRITDEGSGHRSIALEPAAGREDVTFNQMTIDGELHVLPSDAVPFVGDKRIDKDLFNIDLLLKDGYDDKATKSLPLIATTGGSMGTFSTLDATTQGATLPSIHGRSMAVTKEKANDFWTSLANPSTNRLSAGVQKIWLDGRVHADLDRSVAQIGAPTAWEAGFQGNGVKVAVLDTGVDTTHPDLAGRVSESRNFTTSPDATDHFGHGTHVAATIGGSGNGSNGTRKGVAPQANIVSGKVLDDTGNGYESDIIEAMQWAVDADSDVVNMSLGGGATDGTDPLSQAVNNLSASSDTLFVVSAGNDGPGASTIGTPGSADASLTVGAVDRDESLADFSSRGPRLGDLAIKPDITAPGVDIVAARAAGTTMGTPVDALYTTASGTSMAAPHVAGAAALIAQQHPDWTGEQLKDALISTAKPGDLTEQEQGGGRVDLTRAVTQTVSGTGSINLGDVSNGQTEPIVRPVTWTNTGATDVTLDLKLDVTDLGGRSPAEGSITLADSTITVPAKGTASTNLALDPNKLPRGRYAGQLLATAANNVTVHTTVGAVKAAPTHKVTLRAVDFNGDSETATVVALTGEDQRFDTITWVPRGSSRTVELGEGDYFLNGLLTPEVYDEDSVVAIVDPDLEVTRDREIVLDARTATRVEIKTPRPATSRGNLGYTAYRKIGGRTVTHSVMEFDSVRSIWVTPTEPAKGGDFEFTSRWQLAEPLVTATTGGRNPLDLLPGLEGRSPTITTPQRREVVEAGTGQAEDFTTVDVRGKIALVHASWVGDVDLTAAVDAGASMVLLAPEPGTQLWSRYTGRGTRLPLPVLDLSPKERDLLAARMTAGTVNLLVSGVDESTYTYDVVQVSKDQVPTTVVHNVTKANSATVNAKYSEMGGEAWAKEQRFAWRPWQDSTIVESQRELHTPQQRTETISSGQPDTLWRQRVLSFYSWDTMNPINGGAVHALRTYRPGEHVNYDWFGGVVRPAVPAGAVPSRTVDALAINVAELSGAGGVTYDRARSSEATMQLFENDELLASGNQAWGTYTARMPSADYRLNLKVTRTKDLDWEYSTTTDTTWRFRSARPAAGVTAKLPLLQVDYSVPAGLDHQVAAGSVGVVSLKVATATSAKGWVSFDDGASWKALNLAASGKGAWSAQVTHPAAGGHVSLKVQASDAAGNSIEQTVLRAYGVS